MTSMFMLLSDAPKATIPGEHIDKMWSTLITGLVVVFMILALLVFFLWAMGKIMNIKKKPKEAPKQEEAVKAAAVSAPAPQIPEEEYEEDDGEIIAVIAAAIAAYGESEGKQYRVASVKRKDRSLRSSWSAAGISENTRPF
ncbi:MAG: OadG family protein [[Eubacterium] siraeum]|nr:OadG family protein [[Eubacterium] siraeum]